MCLSIILSNKKEFEELAMVSINFLWASISKMYITLTLTIAKADSHIHIYSTMLNRGPNWKHVL